MEKKSKTSQERKEGRKNKLRMKEVLTERRKIKRKNDRMNTWMEGRKARKNL